MQTRDFFLLRIKKKNIQFKAVAKLKGDPKAAMSK